MKSSANKYTMYREKALAEGVRDVASDLRLIDPADLIAYIRTERLANIANLVSSSAELFFQPGTLKFGHSGDIEVAWDAPPRIALDMEFRHQDVSVYFRLLLEAVQAGIEINYITFDGASADPDENTQRLVDAIADARIAPFPADQPIATVST